MMQIQFICTSCKSPTAEKEIEEWVIAKEAICKNMHTIPLKFSESLMNEEIWDECPACHAFHVYLEKSVPKKLLLGILLSVFLISFYLMSIRLWYGIAFLSVFTLLDAILYSILPNRLACYRCGSRARKFPPQAKYHPFDHHVAERYRSHTKSHKV